MIWMACNSKSNNKIIQENSLINSKTQSKETINIQSDTLKINNQKLIQKLIDGKFNCLLSLQEDTIVKSQDYYSKVVFLDINEDGFKDIRVFAFSNMPNQCDNYFFDKKTKVFKLIENCYLDIQKLNGTDFFYSYNSVGCANKDWESYLCKVENYELVNYGYMLGQGCDDDIVNNPPNIEIYKILDNIKNERKWLKSMPYFKAIAPNKDKFNFIKIYWNRNYKTFEK